MKNIYALYGRGDIGKTSTIKEVYKSASVCKLLLQIHICAIYFFSGLDKLLGFNWWNGESVWKSIHLPNLTHFLLISDFIKTPIFYVFMGWSTIIIELLYPIFINIARTRKLWLFLTISMHIGIVITFNLFFFSALMIIWNLTTYYFNYYDEQKDKTSIDFAAVNVFNN